MLTRRGFIKNAGFAAGALLTSRSVLAEQADESIHKVTILHTNDVHSRLEPFAMDGTRNAGLGGIVRRAELISQIRAQEEHVLLLDAGDIFQGTPYFNIYKGEPEIKAMSRMEYDAAIMGNHDFDAGLENFAAKVSSFANFPILMCNYDFEGTPMESLNTPYKIFKKGKLKIGVTGVGIEMKGLVPENLYGNVKYLDPIKNANETAYLLKKKKNCDMVICLSHLGDKYESNKVSDEVFAKESEHVDLIIGGHTHRFFEEPRVYKNKLGSDVVVNQVGWAGIQLGRLDFSFSRNKGKNLDKNHSITVGKS